MPSARRPVLLAIAAILASTAFAGFSRETIPPPALRDRLPPRVAPVRPSARPTTPPHARPAAPALQPRWTATGQISEIRAVDLAGGVTEVPLDAPRALDAPLEPPPGAVELELTLSGPLTLRSWSPRGPVTLTLDLPTLSVPLDDPDAETVRIELGLPEDPATLTAEQLSEQVSEGALATPW